MSAADATLMVRKMVQRESRGWGDLDNAMKRLEDRYGLPFWTIWHLRRGRAKTVDGSVLARIQAAFADMFAGRDYAETESIGADDDQLRRSQALYRALAERIAFLEAQIAELDPDTARARLAERRTPPHR